MLSQERQALLTARATAEDMAIAVERQLAEMVAASETDNADDEHDPEGSTIAFERAQTASMLAMTRVQIVEIDAALQRLSTGDYAVCESCGSPIGEERRIARPSATRCVTCAARGAR